MNRQENLLRVIRRDKPGWVPNGMTNRKIVLIGAEALVQSAAKAEKIFDELDALQKQFLPPLVKE